MSVPSSAGASNSNLGCSASLAHPNYDRSPRFAAVEDISDHLSSVSKQLDPAEDETSTNPGRVKTRILNFGFKRKPEPGAEEAGEDSGDVAIENPLFGWIAPDA